MRLSPRARALHPLEVGRSLVSGSDAPKPHPPRGAVTGEPPAGRTRDADLRGSPAVVHAGCKPLQAGVSWTGDRDTHKPARLSPPAVCPGLPSTPALRAGTTARRPQIGALASVARSAEIRVDPRFVPARGTPEPRHPARSRGWWTVGRTIQIRPELTDNLERQMPHTTTPQNRATDEHGSMTDFG